jgi:Ca2+-binding RTX toxin-like protein
VKLRLIVVLAALALVLTPLLTATAQAASTCTWDSGTATLSVFVDVDEIGTLVVSDTDILFNGSVCDAAATTLAVDTIDVANGGSAVLRMDLSGGPFAPGAEVEATGTSEIEITTDLAFLVIRGTSGADTISLGSNGGNLNGDDDVDVFFTDDGYIVVEAKEGNDSVSGAGDLVVGSALAFTQLELLGNAGNDSLRGGSRFDQLFGGAGDDLLIGGAGGDELMGNGDDDTLEGGPGNDGLRGGLGRDVVTYATSTTGVVVNLKTGNASTNPGGDYEIGGVEDVIGSSFADVLIGDDLGNELQGGGGNDLLNGRGGGDDLFGQAGPRDRASFDGAPSRVIVNLGSGSASGWGGDVVAGVEDATGSKHNDLITGSSIANRLSGGGGNDRIRGGAGSDVLDGNGGRDRALPGAGSDRARGGSGRDTVDLSSATRSVTINLSTGKTAGDGADIVLGFEDAVGSRFADTLVGNGKANVMRGGRGDDKLGGLGRADRLLGSAGQDRLNGGDGSDTLLGGAAHDVLNGGAGDDRLNGGGGPDLLHGNPGNDALNGGPGTDTCYQDAGSGPKTSCEKPAPPPSGSGGGGGGGGGGGCHPSYPDFCIPPPPPDLDCGQVNGSDFTVVGSDPHGFDGDGDGVGCES